MSAFTTSQAGNWSSSSTWGGSGVPGSSDTATVNHAVTVDVNTSTGALAINAALTLATNVVFTRLADTTQGNGVFTMGAGSQIVFATVGAPTPTNCKWLLGTVGNQANCKIVINGSAGNHCSISKTGAGHAWFDAGDEGAGGHGNNGGLVSSYCDWNGISDVNGMAWGSDDFGLMDRRVLHNTFTNCGIFFLSHPYPWSGSVADKDFRVEDCVFTNPTSNALFYAYMSLLNVGVGAGSITFLRNSVGQNSDLYSVKLDLNTSSIVDDNYFDSFPSHASGAPASFKRNTLRMSSNLQTLTGFFTSITDTYFLCDHVDPADRENGVTHVGNPHVVTVQGATLFDGNVIDYPQPALIDGGDGFYGQDDGSFTGSVIQNCLVVPSCADGNFSANIHPMLNGNVRVKVLHNTIVGKAAQLTFNERNQGSNVAISELKSNLVQGVNQSGANWGVVAYDLFWSAYGGVDIITVSGIKNNYVFMPVPTTYDDGYGPIGGTAGYHLTLTSPPDGTNISDTVTGAQFVDDTRCAATWAAYKGYVAPSDLTNNHNRRVALDAVRTALLADPTLGHSDLLPWVRAGFAPQNPVLQDAGHDGVTIGAIEFSGGSGPPAPTGVASVSSRHGTLYVP